MNLSDIYFFIKPVKNHSSQCVFAFLFEENFMSPLPDGFEILEESGLVTRRGRTGRVLVVEANIKLLDKWLDDLKRISVLSDLGEWVEVTG